VTRATSRRRAFAFHVEVLEDFEATVTSAQAIGEQAEASPRQPHGGGMRARHSAHVVVTRQVPSAAATIAGTRHRQRRHRA
jgi:hypothetical protein